MRVVWMGAVAVTVALGVGLAGCGIEFVDGCRVDGDCRFGRVCQGGACVWSGAGVRPGDVDRDTDMGRPDAPDVRDDGVPDGTAQGRLVVRPDLVDFGRLGGGQRGERFVDVVNLGAGSVLVSRLTLEGSNLFSLTAPRDVTLGPDQTLTAVVAVDMPLGLQPGANFDAQLRVEAGAASPPPITVTVEAGGEEVCLQPTGPSAVSVASGETTSVRIDLVNCGAVDVFVDGVSASVDADIADVEIVSVPSPRNAIGPGQSAPLILSVTGVSDGRADARLSVLYNDTEQLSIPLTVQVGADVCAPVVRLAADRGGPETTGEVLTLPMGHQITAAGQSGAFIADLLVTETPEGGRLQALQTSGTGAWLLVPDRPGTYALDLTVVSANGCEARISRELVVEAPQVGFAAWLTWGAAGSGPGGGIADLDLYVARQTSDGYQWQSEGNVSGPGLPAPDFGVAGETADDPTYLNDYNNAGFGPEGITIPEPSGNDLLAIGAHVFNVPRRQAVEAWLVVYLDGELVVEGAVEGDRELGQDNFWLFAETSGIEIVRVVDQIFEGFPPPDAP